MLRSSILIMSMVCGCVHADECTPILFLVGAGVGYAADTNLISQYDRNTPDTERHALFRWVANVVITPVLHEALHETLLKNWNTEGRGLTAGLIYYICNECIKLQQNHSCACHCPHNCTHHPCPHCHCRACT